MKRTFIGMICLAATLWCGCSYIDWDNGLRGDVRLTRADMWSTAVTYPDGYDWKSDTLWGDIPTRLILLRDTSCVLSIEASEANAVDIDTENHLILDGHIYTCHSTVGSAYAASDGRSGTTIIKKDNTEIFRFASRETLEYLEETQEGTLTLGLGRDGPGLTLRRDGKALLHENNASLLGPVHKDGDRTCFCFARNGVAADGGNGKDYFCVEDGNSREVHLPDGASDILCGRCLDGVWNFICPSSDARTLLWTRGEESRSISTQWSAGTRAVSFEKVGGDLLCRIQLKVRESNDAHWNDYFYKWEGVLMHTTSEEQIYAFCHDSPTLCYASSDNARKGPISICRNGVYTLLDSRYVMYSPGAFAFSSSRTGAIGLNDGKDALRPLVIHGSDTLRFGFNGYFTHIYLP